MKTLTIFVSSPGDVQNERVIVGSVIEKLQAKFWSFVRLELVLWEKKALRATAHFQDELIRPSDCDIVLGILWHRLGTPLPEQFLKEDGGRFDSGTEWEIVEAFEGFEASKALLGAEKAAPDVLIYRRMDDRVALEDMEQEELAAEQERKADQFFSRYFLGSDGTNKRAFSPYHKLEEFEENLSDHLTDLILKRIPTLTRDFTPPPINGNPFLGLSHFDFHHNDRFFGRNRAIREVLEKLKAQDAKGHPFVLIYGASGYGKSSLMRAGVAPRLTAKAYLDDIPQWRRILITPSLADGNPIDAIARALIHPQSAHADTPEEAPTLGLSELAGKASSVPTENEQFHYDSLLLSRLLSDPEKLSFAIADIIETLNDISPEIDLGTEKQRQLQHQQQRGACLLLQIDQFEELFTTESITSAQRENFFSLLSHLVHTKRIWIVATMRSEYFPQIAESPNLLPLVQHGGGYILEAPDDKELLEIIRYPALAARLDFENDPTHNNRNLSDNIYDAARKQPDALPLLEFTLDELYQLQDIEAGDRTLNYDEYGTIGRLEGAIAKRAQSTYETLEPHQQDAHQHLFAKLVKVQSSGAGTATKKRAYLDTLQLAHPGAPAFLKAFQKNNLLVTDHEASTKCTNNSNSKGRTTVTLAHEALLTQWPLFKNWIEEHRTDLQAETRLQHQTSRWLEVKNNPKEAKARLLSEANLAEALRVQESELFDLDEDTKTYLQASEKKAKRKTRYLQSALILFAVLATGAGYLGYLSNENAKNEMLAKEDAEQKTKEQNELLWQASQADHEAGLRAEESGSKEESLAYYARAISYRPDNNDVARQAISALISETSPFRIKRRYNSIINTSVSPKSKYLFGTLIGEQTSQGTSFGIFQINTGKKLWGKIIPSKFHFPTWSPNGELVLLSTGSHTLKLFNSKTGNEVCKINYPHESTISSSDCNWLHNRDILLVYRFGMLTAFSISTGDFQWKISTESAPIFSHNKEQVLLFYKKKWEVYNTASGEKHRQSDTPLASSELWHQPVYWSPNSKWYVTITTADTQNLVFYNTNFGIASKTIPVKYIIEKIFWSPDSSSLALITKNNHLLIYDVEKGTDPIVLPFDYRISNVKWSPDSKRVLFITETADRQTSRIISWDINSEKKKFDELVYSNITELAWVGETQKIFIEFHPNSVAVYNTENSSKLFNVKGDYIHLSPSRDRLALIHKLEKSEIFDHQRFELRIYNLQTGNSTNLKQYKGKPIIDEWSPDGVYLTMTPTEDSVEILQAADGEVVWKGAGSLPEWCFEGTGFLVNHPSEYNKLQYYQAEFHKADYISEVDGSNKITISQKNKIINISNDEEYTSPFLIHLPSREATFTNLDDSKITYSRFSPDGDLLAVIFKNLESGKRQLQCLNSVTSAAKWKTPLDLKKNGNYELIWIPISKQIILRDSGSLKIINSSNGKILNVPSSFNNTKFNVIIPNPTGSSFLNVYPPQIWNAETGKLIIDFTKTDGLKALRKSLKKAAEDYYTENPIWAWSPNGQILALAFENEISFWNTTTGDSATSNKIKEQDWISDLQWIIRDNCSLLSYTTGKNTLKFLRPTEKSAKASFQFDFFKKKNLNFSPDGLFLAMNEMGTLKIINLESGNQIAGTALNLLDRDSEILDIQWLPFDNKILIKRFRKIDFFNAEHIYQDFTTSNKKLSILLNYLAGSQFLPNGKFASLSIKELDSHWSKLVTGCESGKQGSLIEFYKWYFELPLIKTVSSTSHIFLRSHISMLAKGSPKKYMVTNVHQKAPWHPLTPLFLARLEENAENEIRKKFLCKLTIERLKASDANIWGNKALAEDAAFAAEKMLDFNYKDLAREGANLSQKLLSNPSALSTLARLSSNIKEMEKWEKLLLDHPGVSAQNLISVAYRASRMNNTSRSKETLIFAHKRFPENVEIFRYEGWSMINLNDYSQALKAFQKAVILSEKNDDDIHLGLAISYKQTNQLEKAITSYKKAISLDKKWASEETITNLNWTITETENLLTILRYTLKKHPELKPKVESDE